MIYTIPNLLSFCRIGIIPIVVIAFYIDTSFCRWATLIIFMFACFTDFLDGYIARAWSQTSRLGKVLDPVADKMLVASVLLLLAGFHKISRLTLVPAIIILCREIMVLGLREYLSEFKLSLSIGLFSKWKTAVQMASIGSLLLGKISDSGSILNVVGEGLLWVAAFMTCATGIGYFKSAIKHL